MSEFRSKRLVTTPLETGQKVLGVVVLALVILVSVLVMLNNVDPSITDATADWLVVSAASDGVNPWTDLTDLADLYGVGIGSIGHSELGEFERVHPRTPGALLLLWPLSTIESESAYPAMLIVAAFAFGATGLLASPLLGWGRFSNVVLVAAGTVGFLAYLSTLEFGTHSSLLMLSVATAWGFLRSKDSAAGGIALGFAITLRLFPVLMVIPLLRHHRKTGVGAALATAGVLNLAGLLAFGLDPAAAVTALTTAGSEWMRFSHNGSLAMPLVHLGLSPGVAGPMLVLGGTLALVFISKSRNLETVFAFAILVGLVVSPLSWAHYDLLALLAAAFLAWHNWNSRASRGLVYGLVVVWVVIQLVATAVDGVVATPAFGAIGLLTLAGRLLLLAGAFLLWPRRLATPDTDEGIT